MILYSYSYVINFCFLYIHMMKHIKLFEEKEEEKEEEKNSSYYRKIYEKANAEIRWGCEDGIENFMKKFSLDYYYLEDSYNGPMHGKHGIYSLQIDRNGYILCEYFDDNGDQYVDLSDVSLDTLIDIFSSIESIDLEDMIEYALNNEREDWLTSLYEGNKDDIDLFKFHQGEDIVDLWDTYKYGARDIFGTYDVQKHILTNHENKIAWFMEKIDEKEIVLDAEIKEEFEDDISHYIDSKELGLL